MRIIAFDLHVNKKGSRQAEALKFSQYVINSNREFQKA